MATIKKAQKGKKISPTYKNLNMGVRNEQYQMTGVNKDVKPSSKDSARYRGGFEQGLKGMKGLPNEGQVEKMGRWEGQNAKKKGKMGIKVKKAQKGSSVNPKFKMDLDKFRMKKASDSTSKVMKKAQKGTNLPSVTVTSKAAPKKNLMERMFGTKEERQDRKLDRENRRLERQANRQANRAERQGNRACRRAGRCGGRGMGYIGYDKNGGTTKKARTGTKVSKSSKKK